MHAHGATAGAALLVLMLSACSTGPAPVHTGPPGTSVVVFEASGTTGRAWASWAVLGPDPVGPQQAQVDLPWSRTIIASRGKRGDLTSWSLSVGDAVTGGTFRCSITVDGHRLDAERGVGGTSCQADLRAG